MAFKASQQTLQNGFELSRSIAQQEKSILSDWKSRLSGDITGLDAIEMVRNIINVDTEFAAIASLPGIAAYAQQQYGDDTYNVGAEFTAMRAALGAIKSWLQANIPANAVYVDNGELAGLTYSPAQTAALLSRVNAALATIE